MNNVSLLKLSGLVVAAAFASCTVGAVEKLDDVATAKVDAAKVNVQTQAVKASDVVDGKVLFAPLDKDQNGVISAEELDTAKNELLQKEFDKIDANKDKGISEEELNLYLAKVEIKK